MSEFPTSSVDGLGALRLLRDLTLREIALGLSMGEEGRHFCCGKHGAVGARVELVVNFAVQLTMCGLHAIQNLRPYSSNYGLAIARRVSIPPQCMSAGSKEDNMGGGWRHHQTSLLALRSARRAGIGAWGCGETMWAQDRGYPVVRRDNLDLVFSGEPKSNLSAPNPPPSPPMQPAPTGTN